MGTPERSKHKTSVSALCKIREGNVRGQGEVLKFYTEGGFKPGLKLIERFTTFLVALKGAILQSLRDIFLINGFFLNL